MTTLRIQSIGAVMLGLLCACGTHTIRAGDPTPRPASSLPADEYRSNLSARITGSVSVNGRVEGDAYSQSQSSGVNARINLAKSANGNEYDHPGQCLSTQKVPSLARSSATVTPQMSEVHRTFGFALDVAARAQNGMWRSRGALPAICTDTHYTEGRARATATGTLQFTFSTPPGGSVDDQLLVTLSGPDASHVQLVARTPTGRIPLQRIATNRFIMVALGSGNYMIEATLEASAGNRRSCDQCGHELSAAVSVQSMRDALNLGYGTPGLAAGRIDVPVLVTTDAILAVVQDSLFGGPDGQFYPCRGDDGDCGRYGRLIYLRNPQIRTDGAWVVIEAELDGNATAWIFRPGVTGHITIAAVPEIVGDSILRLREVQLTTESRNGLVNLVSQRFSQGLVDKIQSRVAVKLNPLLQRATSQLAERFPIPFGPDGQACLDVDLDRLRLRGIEMNNSPDAVLLQFAAETAVRVGEGCTEK